MSRQTRLEKEQALIIHDLRLRLEEAEEILGALRRGEVDALVVKPDACPQIWSLNGVDHVYRVLFETLNEGALTLGPDGAILYSNTQFAGLVGRPLQRVLGTSFLDYVVPSDAEVFRMLLRRGLARSSKGELRLERPDGAQVPALLSFNAVEIEQVGPTVTVVISDLTELKRVQAALADANDHLEARVAERTAALREEIARRERLEQELEERAEALANADRRKNEFLAMLGHELRNPLAPIMNAVEMIRLRGGETPDLERARVVIDRQIRHMARLVDDLLDVSRITRGTVELRKERVDLRAVVESAVNGCHSMFEASQHRLELALAPEPCWLEGDSTRLEQVVQNLLSNAAKYTPFRGRVHVSLERRGDWAELCVRDTGRGIPKEMLGQIFDLFTQVDAPLDRSLGGLGIGLTVVRNLVELHGGRIFANSHGPGTGAEFLVRLPLIPLGRDTNLAPEERSAGRGPGLRVLVVEDNVDSAETLAELLEIWGHQTRVVHHGHGALDAADAFRPNVIILDIGLPGMDGYEVARRLRSAVSSQQSVASSPSGSTPTHAHTHTPRQPLLIALTGYGQEADRRRALQIGFDVHLTKPVNPEQLQRLLAEVLPADSVAPARERLTPGDGTPASGHPG